MINFIRNRDPIEILFGGVGAAMLAGFIAFTLFFGPAAYNHSAGVKEAIVKQQHVSPGYRTTVKLVVELNDGRRYLTDPIAGYHPGVGETVIVSLRCKDQTEAKCIVTYLRPKQIADFQGSLSSYRVHRS